MYTNAVTLGSTPTSVVIMPEYEWAARTVAPSIKANVRRANSQSSSSVRSGFCTEATFSPRACRYGITSAQHEPSAYAPCTSTTFRARGIGSDGGAADARCAPKTAAAAPRVTAAANERRSMRAPSRGPRQGSLTRLNARNRRNDLLEAEAEFGGHVADERGVNPARQARVLAVQAIRGCEGRCFVRTEVQGAQHIEIHLHLGRCVGRGAAGPPVAYLELESSTFTAESV